MIRSYSVETGLDEIGNTSLLKRNPLPVNQTPTLTHRDIRVPEPPNDDSSDGDDYESIVFQTAPKFTLAGSKQPQVLPSQLHSPQLRPPIKINPQDSPVLRRKQNKLPIAPPAKTTTSSSNKNSTNSTTTATGTRNETPRKETYIIEKRGSIQSTTSRDSGVSEKSMDSNRDSIVSNKSIQSSNRGSTISKKNADPDEETVTGTSKSSTTASSKESTSSIEKSVPGIKRESIASSTSNTSDSQTVEYDSDGTYDDVAMMLRESQKAVKLNDESADSDYENVGVYVTRNRQLTKMNPKTQQRSTESNDSVTNKNSQLPLSVKQQQPDTAKQYPSPPKQSLETVPGIKEPSQNRNSKVVEYEKSTNESDFDYVNVSINVPDSHNRQLPKVKPKPAIHHQQTTQSKESNDGKTSLDESVTKRAHCSSPKPTKQQVEAKTTNKEVPLPPNMTVLTQPASSPRPNKTKVPPTPPKKPGSSGGNTGHYSPVISLKTAAPLVPQTTKTMDKEGQGGKRQSANEEPSTKSVKDLYAMFEFKQT